MKAKTINQYTENGIIIKVYDNPNIAKQAKAELREDWEVSCNKCGDDRPPEIRI
jgi:hypothetical protein